MSWLLTAVQTFPLPQHFIQWHTSRLWPLVWEETTTKDSCNTIITIFGCMPETLRITLHGRQIGNRTASIMEANCLSAGLVCISCKSHVHSSETWLTNRTSNSHSEAKRQLKMAVYLIFANYCSQALMTSFLNILFSEIRSQGRHWCNNFCIFLDYILRSISSSGVLPIVFTL